jgi:hypothetical protein
LAWHFAARGNCHFKLPWKEMDWPCGWGRSVVRRKQAALKGLHQA